MKNKNLIFLIISILSVIFCLSLFFVFGLKSVDILDNIPTWSDTLSESENATEETVLENSDDDLLTITIEIYKANFDQSGLSTELYTKLFYHYGKNESYSIELPDYSSQNYYPNSSMVLTGDCVDNRTFKVTYYPAEAELVVLESEVGNLGLICLDYDQHLYKQYQPIVIRNMSDFDVDTLRFSCMYNGNLLESTYITSDYYIPAKGYVVIFPYDSSNILVNPYNSHILSCTQLIKSYMTYVRDDEFSFFVQQSNLLVESSIGKSSDFIPEVST